MIENGYNYAMNGLIAIDQCFNALLAGACDETLSSRTHRRAQSHACWAAFELLVNALFWFDQDSIGRRHCELAYLVEMRSGHMPKAMIRQQLLTA